MKLALILPAVIGMLDSEMSAWQIPGFPDGGPLQVSRTSPTPSQRSPTPSKPIPIPGFPDGRPLQMSPASPTPSRPSPTHRREYYALHRGEILAAQKEYSREHYRRNRKKKLEYGRRYREARKTSATSE